MTITMDSLLAELTGDPENIGYNSMNDDRSADALNAPRVTTYAPVPKREFANWCARTGLRAQIEDHAHNSASPLRSLALRVLDYLQGSEPTEIDFSDTANTSMLTPWVAAGAITVEQQTELMTLAPKKISRAQQLWAMDVTPHDINQARGGA
jgi:hypothetical protein